MTPPTLAEIAAARDRLGAHIARTPVFNWSGPTVRRLFGADTELWLKLEFLQVTGSFKARAALNVALTLPESERKRGFVTFSSGNHAAAVAYAAAVAGTSATVVMARSANPARVANCRRFGAHVIPATDHHEALQTVERIAASEGRVFIHPYEGPGTTCGNATLAIELLEQVPRLDAVIVAIGGGGLCSGIGVALEQTCPDCELLAVEPTGADTMYRSFASGRPERLDEVRTIADSLAPPQTLPYSMDLCRRTVDRLELVSDEQIVAAMALLFTELRLVIEPGGAAAVAGALYAFRDRIRGKRVAVIVCGSNIDLPGFHRHIADVQPP